MDYFPAVVDYNFTANVEREFDEIAEGKENWQDMMRVFYNDLKPEIDKVMNIQLEHKVGERSLGTDPETGKEVSVKIGRFGPIVQIGSANDKDKPRFAQLNKGQSIQSITLEEALDLFKLPRDLGELDGDIISAGTGRYGPFIVYKKKYVSLPEGKDPLTITLDEAVQLIKEKQRQEESNHIKKFEELDNLEIKNGRYGPYIAYNGKNYKLPKSVKEPAGLSLQQCLEIVEKESAKPKKARKG